MEVIVHRGKNQIGGSIIEVHTERTRILLDAGLEFDKEKNRRLPDVEGLFDRKGFDAVFITHYHSDHVGLVYKIHPEIPVYMGEDSCRILKASDKYKRKKCITPAGFLKHKEPISIGDIKITPCLCDHSAYDSYMLLCEGEGQTVLYTGDFRSNGRKSFEALLSDLPESVDVLICEGTTLSREGYVAKDEDFLENAAAGLMKNRRGPVFVLQSPMNIDRIITMYRAAHKSGRIFLQDLYMAEITSAVGGNVPNPDFEDVYPFAPNLRRVLRLLRFPKKAGKRFISRTPFVMCVRLSMLRYMKALSKRMSFENGLLIYSLYTGYKEVPRMKSFLSECERMGLEIKTLHTSGHADGEAIRRLVEKVRPKKIMPVHTEAAEWFDRQDFYGKEEHAPL